MEKGVPLIGHQHGNARNHINRTGPAIGSYFGIFGLISMAASHYRWGSYCPLIGDHEQVIFCIMEPAWEMKWKIPQDNEAQTLKNRVYFHQLDWTNYNAVTKMTRKNEQLLKMLPLSDYLHRFLNSDLQISTNQAHCVSFAIT